MCNVHMAWKDDNVLDSFSRLHPGVDNDLVTELMKKINQLKTENKNADNIFHESLIKA